MTSVSAGEQPFVICPTAPLCRSFLSSFSPLFSLPSSFSSSFQQCVFSVSAFFSFLLFSIPSANFSATPPLNVLPFGPFILPFFLLSPPIHAILPTSFCFIYSSVSYLYFLTAVVSFFISCPSHVLALYIQCPFPLLTLFFFFTTWPLFNAQSPANSVQQLHSCQLAKATVLQCAERHEKHPLTDSVDLWTDAARLSQAVKQ